MLSFLLSAEENQFQLVECGGLPLIITLLTEDSNEEVRKAATFILQTCKQASKQFLFLSCVMIFYNYLFRLFVVLALNTG